MKAVSGKYRARLFDAVRCQTSSGRDAVVFTWDLYQIDERATSTLTLFDSQGRRNQSAIWDAQQWAKRWDGRDLDWFAAHLDELRKIEVDLDVSDGVVGWILPSRREVQVSSPSPREDGSPVAIKLIVDPEVLNNIPADIEPTAINAKTLFDEMTAKTDREDANLVWTMMAEKIGPMQIDFTSEQWAQMITMIRNLKSATFNFNKNS